MPLVNQQVYLLNERTLHMYNILLWCINNKRHARCCEWNKLEHNYEVNWCEKTAFNVNVICLSFLHATFKTTSYKNVLFLLLFIIFINIKINLVKSTSNYTFYHFASISIKCLQLLEAPLFFWMQPSWYIVVRYPVFILPQWPTV